MRKVPLYILGSIGVLLLGSLPSAAATDCPRFLVSNGYADLCGPGAWMAFEHQDHDSRLIKRRLHHDRAARGAKVKYRPRHNSSKK
jgi:hypothetical protein